MKMMWGIVVVGVFMMGAAVFGAEEALKPSVAAGVDLRTAYIYRATVYNDGYVVQPWAEATVGPVTVGVWANHDLEDFGGTLEKNRISEVDLTLTYAFPSIYGWDSSIGYAEYLFPNVADGEGGALLGTREVIVTVGRPIGGGFAVRSVLSYDVDQVEDYHAALRLSFAHTLCSKMSFSAYGQGGYVGRKFSASGESGFYDYDVRLSVSYALNDHLELGIMGGYTGSLDTEVLADPSENIYGGLSVATFF